MLVLALPVRLSYNASIFFVTAFRRAQRLPETNGLKLDLRRRLLWKIGAAKSGSVRTESLLSAIKRRLAITLSKNQECNCRLVDAQRFISSTNRGNHEIAP